MFLRFLFYAFLFYLAYKVLFGLIIPLYRTTRQVKRGIRQMQEHMRSQAGPYPEEPVQQKVKADPGKGGDYIEFEEIK
jgi:hypothetical protein